MGFYADSYCECEFEYWYDRSQGFISDEGTLPIDEDEDEDEDDSFYSAVKGENTRYSVFNDVEILRETEKSRLAKIKDTLFWISKKMSLLEGNKLSVIRWYFKKLIPVENPSSNQLNIFDGIDL